MKNKVSKKTNKHRRITKRKGKFNLSGGALNLERLNKVLENFDGFVWDFDGTIVTNIVHNDIPLSLDTSPPVLDQIERGVYMFFFQPAAFVELVNFLVYNGKKVGIISFGSIQNILHILKKLFSSYGYECPFSYYNVKGSYKTNEPVPKVMRENKKVNFINNFARDNGLSKNKILFFDDDYGNAQAVSKNGFKGISLIGYIASQLKDYKPSTSIKTAGFSVEILYLINDLLENKKSFDSNLLIKAPNEILEEQSSQKLKKSKKKSKKIPKVKSYKNTDPYTHEPIFNTIEEAKKRNEKRNEIRNEIRKTKKKGLAGLAQRLYRFVTKRRQPEAPASPPTTEPSTPASPPPRESAAPASPPPRESAAPASPPTNGPKIVYVENTPSVKKLKNEKQKSREEKMEALYMSVKPKSERQSVIKLPNSKMPSRVPPRMSEVPPEVPPRMSEVPPEVPPRVPPRMSEVPPEVPPRVPPRMSTRVTLASNRHIPTNSNRKRLDEQAMKELQTHSNESENSTNESRVSSGEIKEIQKAKMGSKSTTSNPRKSHHTSLRSEYDSNNFNNTNPFKTGKGLKKLVTDKQLEEEEA